MADNRVLYMSDLGRKTIGGSAVIEAVQYLVCVRQVDAFDDVSSSSIINDLQLGRILNRIHMLGTLRVAALKNLRLIRDASFDLSNLDPSMQSARKSLTQKTVNTARRQFSNVTDRFLREDKTKSGLQYRIERSRHYVSRFRENVKSLRIGRVEGYQKYDDLVERRMGDVFDFVDRVGVRYERAAGALSLIEQNYMAIKSEKYASSLEDIQRWGELLLIGILLPYYIQGSLYYLSYHGEHAHLDHKDAAHLLMSAISFGLFIFAISRFFKGHKFRECFIEFSFSVSLYAMFWLVFMILSGNLENWKNFLNTIYNLKLSN